MNDDIKFFAFIASLLSEGESLVFPDYLTSEGGVARVTISCPPPEVEPLDPDDPMVKSGLYDLGDNTITIMS